MPPRPCQTCDKCKSTLATSSGTHPEPIPHKPVTRYHNTTGEPYKICNRCREILEPLEHWRKNAEKSTP